MARTIFAELPPDVADRERLGGFLGQRDGAHVLEISDSNTKGLGGPVRADEVPEYGESTDFVDFLRNIGSPRDVHHGGGTYGYGKSSLYASSLRRTIVVDTVTRVEDEFERRVIGSIVGSRFDQESGPEQGRFTGRHWWGHKPAESGSVIPVTGQSASEIVTALGLFERSSDQTGTSILILDPDLGGKSIDQAALSVRNILLKYFWPKMVAEEGERVPMHFRLIVNGADQKIPKPEETAPFHILAKALNDVRSRSVSSKQIRVKSLDTTAGYCAFGRDLQMRSDVRGLWPDKNESFHHVALMRPAELVVRYLEGAPIQEGSVDWGGVFICNDDEEIESAFAASEPPAHDDWIPSYLPSGAQKTIVNAALRRIRAEIRQYSDAPVTSDQTADRASVFLGDLADTVGERLLVMSSDRLGGTGRGPTRARTPGGGGRTTAGAYVGRPQFKRIEQGTPENEIYAVFEISVSNSGEEAMELLARPAVVWDEGGAPRAGDDAAIAPNGKRVDVLGWRNPGQELVRTEAGYRLHPGETDRTLEVLVSIPDTVAVTLEVISSATVVNDKTVPVNAAPGPGVGQDRNDLAPAGFQPSTVQEGNVRKEKSGVAAERVATNKKPVQKKSAVTDRRQVRSEKKRKRKKSRRGRLRSTANVPIVVGAEAKKIVEKRVSDRKTQRKTTQRAPDLTTSNPKSMERHEQKCGCMGNLENCLRCYGKGSFIVDGHGNIVSS
jgi:hypothetical protein